MDEHERNSQEVPDQEELEAKRLPWESLWTGCGVGDRAGFRGYVSTEEEAFKVKDAYEIWSSLKFNVEAGFAKPQPELQQRVRYSDINDSVVVADGVPFVGNHQQTYCCMFGKDKHAKSKKKGQGENEENLMKDHPVPRKRKYRLVQPSRKKGCTAKIKMKKVVRYPDFKVDVNATHWKKNHISAQIRAALAKGEELNREERIYISLPDDVDHNGHDVGKLTGFVKPIDSRVSSKLTELVGQGVSNLREMRRHLRIYVETVLCPDLKPSPSDTAFYPSDEVLGTRMYAAKMKLR